MKLLSELVEHIRIDASGEWSQGLDPGDVALPRMASVILIIRQITKANSKSVPTRPARELHPGGDSYVEHYNSFWVIIMMMI